MEVEKNAAYDVYDRRLDAEDEAEEAMYREFLFDVMAKMNWSDHGVAGALNEVLKSLRDMEGLSKQKLQKLIDVLVKMSEEAGYGCED